MSRSTLVLFAAFGAALLGSAASAGAASPFTGADCREARLDRVVGGAVVSSDPVIICKRSDHIKAALLRTGARLSAAPARAEASPERRSADHVAFTAPVPTERECVSLNCPTYLLTGVGD